MRKSIGIVALSILFVSVGQLSAEPDLRQQFGTRSLDAARHLDAAIKLDQAKRPDDALKEVDSAVAADPNFALGWMWKGEISKDLGDIDKCIEAYHRCIALDVDPANRSVTTTAKTNLGLLFGQLKRFDESAYWFARAIVDDSDDHNKEQAKAYRNLALTLHFQGRDLAATLAAITGQDIDPDRVEDGLIDDLSKRAADQEVARVLALEQDVPKVTTRVGAKLTEVKVATAVTDHITQIFPDPRGAYLVALSAGADHYYIIELHAGAGPTVKQLKIAAGKITTGSMAGGKLFVVAADPAKIQELDPLTDKAGRSWDLPPAAAPTSLAVLPSKNAAFVPAKDHIQWLDLQTGKLTETGLPGQVVTADPAEKYIYSRFKDPPVSNEHMVLVDGHPIFIQSNNFDWNQTALFKFYVAPHKLLPAAVRLNAAANGMDVVVSPDGQWVSCPGGGGWRPDAGGGGYTIPAFSTADFNLVQKSFAIDAYPTGCAFNPVTQQFAGIRGADAKIYHLAGDASKPDDTLKGPFGPACAWSGDGRYLVTSRGDKGINIYQNTLSADETRYAQTWWKKILSPTSSAVASGGTPPSPPSVGQTPAGHGPVDSLAKYQPAIERAAVQKSLSAALASKSTDKALEWRQFPAYAAATDAVAIIDELNGNSAEAGVRIYEFKKALTKDPHNVPLQFYLAEAMLGTGQNEGAQAKYLEVVHTDAGRTDMTEHALIQLAVILVKAGKDLPAADCLAQSLALDRADHHTIAALAPVLQKLRFTDEAKRLAKETPAGSAVIAGLSVPPLLIAPGDAPLLTPAELFTAAAPSVVLIQCRNSSGTAVCVAKDGILLTSRHVVVGADTIDVYPFAILNGKAKRLGKHSAVVVAESEKDDLAILRMDTPPQALKPMPVAEKSPSVGEKIFALGNPGLGRQTLDLSFSEGIVSSVDRTVRGNSYLQHTAAVNPGNSGGPLISDTGVVVGLVCLKADLEGVSFGTPVEAIRAFYRQHASDESAK